MAYEYRKDHRTDAEFARDIKERTEKENRCVKLWFDAWIKPSYPNIELLDTGVDNSGEVIRGRGDFGSADFGLRFPGKSGLFHVEAKASYGDVMTVKAASLQVYEQHYAGKRFWLLCFVLCGRRAEPGKGTGWFLLKLDQFDAIRQEARYQKHDPAFGGKATFRFGEREIKEWTTLRRLYV